MSFCLFTLNLEALWQKAINSAIYTLNHIGIYRSLQTIGGGDGGHAPSPPPTFMGQCLQEKIKIL